MHREQCDFCERVRARYLSFFVNTRVLDCGSLNVNGTNQYLFAGGCYWGVDIAPGPNVDIVSKIHELPFRDGLFDVVISTECLEHDLHWETSIRKMAALVRPDGLLLFTCATTGRAEHGTVATTAGDSPFTPDYYRNLTEKDVRYALDLERQFSTHLFEANEAHHDLYFFGIKR